MGSISSAMFSMMRVFPFVMAVSTLLSHLFCVSCITFSPLSSSRFRSHLIPWPRAQGHKRKGGQSRRVRVLTHLTAVLPGIILILNSYSSNSVSATLFMLRRALHYADRSYQEHFLSLTGTCRCEDSHRANCPYRASSCRSKTMRRYLCGKYTAALFQKHRIDLKGLNSWRYNEVHTCC